MGEKEVHGSGKCGAEGDGDDDEKIGQDSEQENEQKDNEEYFLQVWILCESQENKFSHIAGKPEEIHLVAAGSSGLNYLQRNKEWYLLIMKGLCSKLLRKKQKQTNKQKTVSSLLLWGISLALCLSTYFKSFLFSL